MNLYIIPDFIVVISCLRRDTMSFYCQFRVNSVMSVYCQFRVNSVMSVYCQFRVNSVMSVYCQFRVKVSTISLMSVSS